MASGGNTNQPRFPRRSPRFHFSLQKTVRVSRFLHGGEVDCPPTQHSPVDAFCAIRQACSLAVGSFDYEPRTKETETTKAIPIHSFPHIVRHVSLPSPRAHPKMNWFGKKSSSTAPESSTNVNQRPSSDTTNMAHQTIAQLRQTALNLDKRYVDH